MVTDQQVIGIDLGGTAIKLARFSIQGDMLAELERPTPQPAVPGAVTMALCEAVETHLLCSPLKVTSKRGRVVLTPQMLAEQLARQVKFPAN